MVGEKQEKKLVVWFTNDRARACAQQDQQPHVCGAFGDDIDGWAGKIIVVFPTMADFRGKMVPALRVRIPPPKDGYRAPASASQSRRQSRRSMKKSTALTILSSSTTTISRCSVN